MVLDDFMIWLGWGRVRNCGSIGVSVCFVCVCSCFIFFLFGGLFGRNCMVMCLVFSGIEVVVFGSFLVLVVIFRELLLMFRSRICFVDQLNQWCIVRKVSFVLVLLLRICSGCLRVVLMCVMILVLFCVLWMVFVVVVSSVFMCLFLVM